MKRIILKRSFVLILIALNTACSVHIDEKKLLVKEIEIIKSTFAPDKRTALFNLEVLDGPSGFTLAGETNLPLAVDSLNSLLKEKGIKATNDIKILPAEELEGMTKAVINISAANLRSNPKHSAELATQATLGTVINVLKKEGDWYLIQTPDMYLAWVDNGGIQLMNANDIKGWNTADKIIYTNTYGHAYNFEEGKNRISDIVAGSLLKLLSSDDEFYKIEFPDGRQGYISKDESEDYDTWLSNLSYNADSLIATSKTLMGVPYLWGGTSTKGVDCSGYTKTIYYLNGMVIPRDASQQVHAGKPIDSIADFSKLQKGDLLFFGRKATETIPEKVVHVGMWIGDNQFIHSSEMVRISSVDEDSPNYDAFNVGRYLRTQRLLNEEDPLLQNLNLTKPIKD
ncbi:SH3 domain-containing C40 family peptidase [Maribacter sp. 1_MG-2023]|uniref:SH3 domain-containing C40 family peptidase n=1 Tax=Maribacter sp. 1_MG-2023 TaxID=3062677 RepID=UPI0026E443BB|nr:SH3 domain-containing C40 family peptidase [Maribacter sp. 1_MG-2023]MDO6471637.1 SH3 domain-containing C40 family peptidase [Maribacter sp. 1_MG-2023]